MFIMLDSKIRIEVLGYSNGRKTQASQLLRDLIDSAPRVRSISYMDLLGALDTVAAKDQEPILLVKSGFGILLKLRLPGLVIRGF